MNWPIHVHLIFPGRLAISVGQSLFIQSNPNNCPSTIPLDHVPCIYSTPTQPTNSSATLLWTLFEWTSRSKARVVGTLHCTHTLPRIVSSFYGVNIILKAHGDANGVITTVSSQHVVVTSSPADFAMDGWVPASLLTSHHPIDDLWLLVMMMMSQVKYAPNYLNNSEQGL